MENQKQIPMLFSTMMVQALLEGRKTMTRRIIKSRHESGLFQICKKPDGTITNIESLDWDERNCEKYIVPKWKAGDIIWVRETCKVGAWNDLDHKVAFNYKASPELKKTPWMEYEDISRFDEIHEKTLDELLKRDIEAIVDEENERFYYCWEPGQSPLKWKPSIFMPKEAARIWLKVKSITVERLHEITEDDAIREGIELIDYNCFKNYDPKDPYQFLEDPIGSFKSLWEYINGIESWHSNPFVWVVEFEVLSTTGKPAQIK